MATIKPLDIADTPEASAKLIESVEQQVGHPFSILRMFAHSPAMLDAYVHFWFALEQSQMTPLLRHLVSVTVAQEMGGEYMLSGLSALGSHEGASAAQIADSRRAQSDDPKTLLALQFAVKAVQKLGRLPTTEVALLRQGGFSDQEIVELVGFVSLNIWRNLHNMILEVPNDFPPVNVHLPALGVGHA